MEEELAERAIAGLHDFTFGKIIRRYARPGCRAVDLGAGSGAMAARLRTIGLDVMAADMDPAAFKADLPFVRLDLDNPVFPSKLGIGKFSLVTAVEVIEHVESPIGFLRSASELLAGGGVLVLTTPNVDNAPARIRFLLSETIRMMDTRGDPTHISPVFWDLFTRQYLPRAGLSLLEHHLYPRRGFLVSQRRYAWALKGLALFLPGECAFGDNHVIVLCRQGDTSLTREPENTFRRVLRH